MKKSSMEEHHQLPQARQSKASYHRVENVSDEMKEQAEALTLMHGESSRTGHVMHHTKQKLVTCNLAPPYIVLYSLPS
ncbi:hypothetical protein DKX38_014792 [Salix brachista]|uniref:Uncharacterized protein n=1 Tax=Salix brachista TaxID=2182728 RepID=A0A5N5LH29_9ROSI|nr:hypothetical protein DKX38_014792 [Salix brachista]